MKSNKKTSNKKTSNKKTSVKKTTITVETERVYLLNRKLSQGWCTDCSEEVNVVRLEEAALLSGIETTALCRRIEDRTLHVREDANGQLLICFPSLIRDREFHKDSEP